MMDSNIPIYVGIEIKLNFIHYSAAFKYSLNIRDILY